jgi:hypothetical protein
MGRPGFPGKRRIPWWRNASVGRSIYTTAGPHDIIRLSFTFLEQERFMRKLFIAVAVAVCLPLALAAQDTTLKDYSKTMQSEDLPLNIIHLNAKTIPLLFKAPTLYQIRAKAAETTMVYVQTVVEVNGELDTSAFTLEQDGMSYPGTPSSVRNFTKGRLRLKLGDQVDGVVTFPKLVDLSKSFVVKNGRDRVEFKFSDAQIKALAPAPAAQ